MHCERRAAQPRLLVIEKQHNRQLLDVVAIRQAVIPQDAAVVPERLDEGGGCGHWSKGNVVLFLGKGVP